MKKINVFLLISVCSVMMVGCGIQSTNTDATSMETVKSAEKNESMEKNETTPIAESTEKSETKEIVESAGMVEGEEDSVLMIIQDIFSIRDHGVVITGRINQGTINVNDVINVNGESYTVFLIEVIDPTARKLLEVESVEKGTDAALHLSTMDASVFAQGDVVRVE